MTKTKKANAGIKHDDIWDPRKLTAKMIRQARRDLAQTGPLITPKSDCQCLIHSTKREPKNMRSKDSIGMRGLDF